MGALRESKRLIDPDSVRARCKTGKVETHSSHLIPANMELLVLFPARRLDLDMVPWPTTVPRRGSFGSEPFPRELTPAIEIRKVCVSLALERGKARDVIAQLARPVVRSKVVQRAEK
jgi:hypothetical protein